MQVTTTTVSIDGHDIPARRIEYGDIVVTVRQRLYKDRLTRAALERKLVQALPDSAAPEDEDEQTQRLNYCYFCAQSALEGTPVTLATRESTIEEVEALFQDFLYLPDSLIARWLVELNTLENTNSDPASKPPHQLTPKEAKDPHSAAPRGDAQPRARRTAGSRAGGDEQAHAPTDA